MKTLLLILLLTLPGCTGLLGLTLLQEVGVVGVMETTEYLAEDSDPDPDTDISEFDIDEEFRTYTSGLPTGVYHPRSNTPTRSSIFKKRVDSIWKP